MGYAVRRIDIWDQDPRAVAPDEPAHNGTAVADGPRIDARDLQDRLVAAFHSTDAVDSEAPRLSYRRRAAIIAALACGLWIPILSGFYLMLA